MGSRRTTRYTYATGVPTVEPAGNRAIIWKLLLTAAEQVRGCSRVVDPLADLQ